VERLVKIPAGYKLLEKELVPSQGIGERVGGSKTPPIPVKLEVLHLRTTGIKEPLLRHEHQIRHQQRHTRVQFRGQTHNYIQESCKYLVTHERWIFAEYKQIDELSKEIAVISRAIDSALGHRSEMVTIGTCPAMDEQGETCGYCLQVNPATLNAFSDIVCPSCRTTWSSTRWRLLGRMLDDNLPGSNENLQGVASDPV
jgi:hypothetical protein